MSTKGSKNEVRDPGYSHASVNLDGVTDRSIGKLVDVQLRALRALRGEPLLAEWPSVSVLSQFQARHLKFSPPLGASRATAKFEMMVATRSRLPKPCGDPSSRVVEFPSILADA